MRTVICISIALLLVCGTQARLVFPPGSDVGYIVPDDPGPQKFEDDTNWLNDIDTDEYDQPLLQRGEREALSDVESAFWHAVEDSVKREGRRSAQDEDKEDEEDKVKIDPIENWHGKWFPHAPKVSSVSDVPADLPDSMKDDKHGITMGVPHAKCDTGKVNLTMDWDFSPINYTCYNPRHHRIPVQASLSSVEECVDLPKNYTPQHFCMNRKITYNTTLPTYGPHRPLWPVFGEYKFVPVQRWLHSIEHGAIVMLYDPCTQPTLVHQLRKLVRKCIRKHIITPYTLLSRERPLALLAWGCSLEMSTVNEKEVKTFIKKHGLHGPEGHYVQDGTYKEGLIRKAEYPADYEDKESNLCMS
ncbi:uncharacterized protein [Panulirus ornatus]|uniref:uncharacterized protein n=1 Tax=Panulirus ornatus TaxID=150431 RepID=UPI003A891469